MFVDLVKDIAKRLKDPHIVEQKVLTANGGNSSQILYDWSPLTLSHGYPGLVVLFGTLDNLYPSEGWDLTAHAYILKITGMIEASGVSDLSLFSGLTGCCFAIQHASKKNTRYQNIINHLHEFIFHYIEQMYFKVIHEKLSLKLPLHPNYYDLMSGIGGIGLYLLNQLHCSKCLSVLKKILTICVALTEKREIWGYHLQGWYVPQHYQFTESDKEIYRKGNFNLGVSHGIPGILGLLSLALLKEVKVEKQKEAIKTIVDWIFQKRKTNKGISYWPNRISFDEEILGQQNELSDCSVEAWCYGSPGICRMLFLAGKALKEQEIQRQAQNIFFTLFDRDDFKQTYYTPTFCHGLAGMLTLTKLMVRDSSNKEYNKKIKEIEDKLFSYYNPQSNFGFKNHEIHSHNLLTSNHFSNQSITERENIGLLSGVSGVLLSLISDNKDKYLWATPFALEGG